MVKGIGGGGEILNLVEKSNFYLGVFRNADGLKRVVSLMGRRVVFRGGWLVMQLEFDIIVSRWLVLIIK